MMRRIVTTVGALLAAAILFQAAAIAQSEPRVLGGSYFGTFDGQGEGCTSGSVYAGPETGLDVIPDGTRIIGLLVTDVVSPLGNFTSLTIPMDAQIAEDGTFDSTFDPLSMGLTTLHVEGQFDGESVSGSFSSQPPDGPGCSGTFTMEWVPPPPVTYRGTVHTSESGCGNGGIAVTVTADGLSVIEIAVDGIDVAGAQVSASATFAEGSVPVAEDGSFGWTYFPGGEPGQEVAVLGTVDSGMLTGAITVSPFTCGPMPFVSAAPTELARGGGGPAAGASSLGWALAAAAFGVAALAAGAALRRKER